MSRPPKGAEKRTRRLLLTFSPEEYARLVELARAEGKRIAVYLRERGLS